MSNYHRSTTSGATYFFTVVTYKRNPILCNPAIREALRKAIIKVKKQMPFTIEAWVLMPDHLHCIWTLPPKDNDYSKRWGLIKRAVSRSCKSFIAQVEHTTSGIKRHELAFWQRRFWEHQIRDKNDFNQHMDYIHHNPVKHGLCKTPSQWRWSTIHRYIKKGIYTYNWCMYDDSFNTLGEP